MTQPSNTNCAHCHRAIGVAATDRLITPLAAAERLGLISVSRAPHREVLKLARRGELQGRRVGRWTLIVEKSIDRLIAGGEGA